MRAIAAFLLASAALLSIGCSDTTTGSAPLQRSTMSATVGSRGVVMTTVVHDRVELKYYVSGTSSDSLPNDNIVLSFDTLRGPGTYTVGSRPVDVKTRYLHRTSSTSSEEYKGITGTVKIEEYSDERAGGTFSFEAQLLGGSRIVRIAEGAFTTIRR